MGILYIVLSSLMILICIALVVSILLQKKKAGGLSGTISGMGAQQTFWDKNKGNSFEGQLEKFSKIGGVAFMVIALVLNLIK